MNKRLGFGIIGCGAIVDWHVYSVLNTKGTRIVAVSDTVEERAKKVAEENNVEWYTNYRKMLERDDVDIVNICTPSGTHGEIVKAAVKMGKHIIVEKPMEITLEKCDEMIDTCKEAGVKLEVIFQSRFYPSTRKLKEAVEAGRFGRLILGSVYNKYYRSQEYYDSGNWRGTWELDGGGVLMNQAVHGIDLLQYIMGPVGSLYAYVGTLTRRIKTEDTAVAILKFESGALGVIEGATSVYPGFLRKLEIHGEKGTGLIEGEDIVKWEFRRKKDGNEKAKERKKLDMGLGPTTLGKEAHRVQIEEMIKAIKEDREPLVNGLEGRKAVEIVLAIYKSAKEGKEVSLPLKSNSFLS